MKNEKEYPLLVTRNTLQPYSPFSAFIEVRPNMWLELSGFPGKNGEGTGTSFSSHRFSCPLEKQGTELLAKIYLPGEPSSEESLAVNTFWAVLHVLDGHDPIEFLGMRRYRRFSREVGWIFKQALDKGRIPVEIRPSIPAENRPSSEMILRPQDIVTLSLRGLKRPSCVF